MPDPVGPRTPPHGGWLQRIFGIEPRRPRRFGPDGEPLDPYVTPATDVPEPSASTAAPPPPSPPPAAATQPPAGPNWLQRIFGIEPRRPRRFGPDGEPLTSGYGRPVDLAKPVLAAPAADRTGGLPGRVIVGGLVLVGAIATVAVAVLVGLGGSPAPTGATGATGASGVAGASRPSGATGPVAADGTTGTTRASVPAATSPPAPCGGCAGRPADAGAGAVGASGPSGASGPAGAVGPAGIPASCVLSADQVTLGVGGLAWQEEDDGLYASWEVTAANSSSDGYTVFIHKIADANAATRSNKWRPYVHDWYKAADADGKVFEVNLMGIPSGWSQSIGGTYARISTSVEPDLPTLCSYEYTDRVVAVWDRPECRGALYDAVTGIPDTDAAAQEALLGPWAIAAPLPDQFTGWSCPP